MRFFAIVLAVLGIAACDGGEPLGATTGLADCQGTITEMDGGNGATCFTTCYTGGLKTKVNNCHGFAFNGEEVECKSSCDAAPATPESQPPVTVPTVPATPIACAFQIDWASPGATGAVVVSGKAVPCHSCLVITGFDNSRAVFGSGPVPVEGCLGLASDDSYYLCTNDPAKSGCYNSH